MKSGWVGNGQSERMGEGGGGGVVIKGLRAMSWGTVVICREGYDVKECGCECPKL